MRVKDVMETDVYILCEEDKISQASEFMRKERIRNLPVVDENKKLVGLVTLREIVDALSNKKSKVNSEDLKIGDIMIREVKSIGPETPLKGAVEVMILNKFGSMPVTDSNKRLLGMLTEYSLLKKLYEMSELPNDFYVKEEKKKAFKI